MSEENDIPATEPENNAGGGNENDTMPSSTSTPAEPSAAEPKVPADVVYDVKFRDAEQNVAEDLKAMFKTAGLTNEAANSLTKDYYALQDKLKDGLVEKSKRDLEEWKAAQGDALAKNQELARRGSAALGLSEEQISTMEFALGTKAFMELCLRQGTAMSEDSGKGMSGSGAAKSEEMSTVEYLDEIFNNAKGM